MTHNHITSERVILKNNGPVSKYDVKVNYVNGKYGDFHILLGSGEYYLSLVFNKPVKYDLIKLVKPTAINGNHIYSK